MITNRHRSLTAILWDSVSEPENLLQQSWNSDVNRDKAAYFWNRDDRDISWLGVEDVPTLRKTLSEGWPEGVAKLEQIALRELASPASIRRRRIRSDQGDEVDMQAVYRGDISRAWTRTRRQSRTGVRSITLVIDLCASWQVSADKLFWRGASALRLASELLTAGYNVAIYAASGSGKPDEAGKVNVAQFIEIKGEDSPFDIDRLAALTCLPGFFRTHLFMGNCFAVDGLKGKVKDSLGKPSNELIRDAIKLLPIPQNAFVQQDVLDKAAAEQWIESVLQQIEAGNLEAA
ncbi:MAG: hypothetical protein ACK42H_19505 [Planctomycetota bacterium]